MADAMIRGSFEGVDPAAYGPAYQQSDTGTIVEFYYHKVAQKDFCRMTFPGNKLTRWDQPVREQDKVRFPQQWALYQQGKDQNSGQTMLNTWGDIDPGSIEEYGYMNVRTVEQLAALPDANISQFPPGMVELAYRHRTMARDFLESKKRSEGFNEAMTAAEESQRVAAEALQENAALKAQLEELARRVDAAGAPPSQEPDPVWPKVHKRKPGGWEYELSDGQIIVGKKAAEDAQRVLDSVG